VTKKLIAIGGSLSSAAIDTDGWQHISVLPKVSVSQGDWSLTFPSAGFPKGNIAVQTSPEDDSSTTPKPNKTHAIEFIPSDFYTREPMVLSVKSPDTSHTDIYFWDDNKNKWEAMNAVKGAGVLTVKVRWLGKFALFEDHVAPGVGGLMHRDEARLKLRRWYWPASDVGEGIDVEGCRATVNGKTEGAPEVDYDPDRDWAEFFRPLDWKPPEGLSVSCTDRAGNSSSGVRGRGRAVKRPRGRKRR
jgi:hypothetical protein